MKKYLIVILISAIYLSCASKEKIEFNIGQRSVTYIDETRSRPLKVEVWYPTNDALIQQKDTIKRKELFKTIKTIPNASVPNKKFPLLLMSHGTGGNRFSQTWLIETLVKEGYVVVSLGHYGNTTFNKLPREFVKWWERAIDIQFVIDNVLENPELKQFIDETRIGGIGYSLGGYTNIALAGGLVDRDYNEEDEEDTNRELPPEFPKTDEIIDFDTDSLIVSSFNKYKNKVKDNRMSAFFVMAPAIGFGFHSKEQTKDITAPIFIVAGKGDTNTPITFNALNYHNLIDTSELHLFDENVGHYVFLNESTEFGKKVAPQITIDKDGVDRGLIHEQTSALALSFFNKHLKNK